MNKQYRIGGKEVWMRCPLCGAEVPVMAARTGKPYIQCHCGVQTFFRTPPSILLLERAVKDPEVGTFFFKDGHDEAVDVEGTEGANEKRTKSLDRPTQKNEQKKIHSNLAPETPNKARNASRNWGNPEQVPAKTKDSSKSSVPEIIYYIAISVLLGLGLLTGVQYLQSATAKAHLARYSTSAARTQTGG